MSGKWENESEKRRCPEPWARGAGGPDTEGYAHRPMMTQPAGAAITATVGGFGAQTVIPER